MDIPTLLDQAGEALATIPNWALLLGLSAFCATLADDVKDRYLLHYWLTFAAGYGGGATSALILMRPDEVAINYLSARVDIIWTLTWWAINYFPFNIPGRVHSFLPVRMTSKCVKYHPATVIAPVVLGTIGGSGGKIISDMIRGGYGMSVTRDEMSMPSFSLQSGIFCSILYYWLVHISALLTATQATTLVTLLMIFQGVIADLTGTAFNFTKPAFTAFHVLTNIPQPVPVGAAPRKLKAKPDEDKKKE